MNLRPWRNELNKQNTFPYAMSYVLIHTLKESFEILFEESLDEVLKMCEIARKVSWQALKALNLG